MNLMIASDIHGSVYFCKKMLEAFERERANRLLLLGDILYTCTCCGHKGFCVEVYGGDKK